MLSPAPRILQDATGSVGFCIQHLSVVCNLALVSCPSFLHPPGLSDAPSFLLLPCIPVFVLGCLHACRILLPGSSSCHLISFRLLWVSIPLHRFSKLGCFLCEFPSEFQRSSSWCPRSLSLCICTMLRLCLICSVALLHWLPGSVGHQHIPDLRLERCSLPDLGP